jgi:hypothetical protein
MARPPSPRYAPLPVSPSCSHGCSPYCHQNYDPAHFVRTSLQNPGQSHLRPPLHFPLPTFFQCPRPSTGPWWCPTHTIATRSPPRHSFANTLIVPHSPPSAPTHPSALSHETVFLTILSFPLKPLVLLVASPRPRTACQAVPSSPSHAFCPCPRLPASGLWGCPHRRHSAKRGPHHTLTSDPSATPAGVASSPLSSPSDLSEPNLSPNAVA